MRNHRGSAEITGREDYHRGWNDRIADSSGKNIEQLGSTLGQGGGYRSISPALSRHGQAKGILYDD